MSLEVVHVNIPDVVESFPAIHDPSETWDGNLVPGFRLDTARQIVEQINAREGLFIRLLEREHPAQGTIFIEYERRGQTWEPVEVYAPVAGHYWLGAYSWFWKLAEPVEVIDAEKEITVFRVAMKPTVTKRQIEKGQEATMVGWLLTDEAWEVLEGQSK